jgi:hypothetical protein
LLVLLLLLLVMMRRRVRVVRMVVVVLLQPGRRRNLAAAQRPRLTYGNNKINITLLLMKMKLNMITTAQRFESITKKCKWNLFIKQAPTFTDVSLSNLFFPLRLHNPFHFAPFL